jgi:4'-phosphopantetheinyl transferase
MSLSMARPWEEPIAPLEVGHTHLWLCDIDAILDEATRSTYLALLDEQESSRIKRLVFARDKHRFLVSHALLRSVLARYTGQAGQRLRFRTGAHGKPELVTDLTGSTCRFNLSHSGSRALLAVTRAESGIGVDIEFHETERRLAALAERNFAPVEAARLQGLSGAALVNRFYEFWTLKEAYIKARGVGLSQSLREFWFLRDVEGILEFDALPIVDPAPEKWRFWCYRLPGYSAALAVQAAERAALPDPVWFRAEPLLQWAPTEADCILRSGRITGN